MENQTLDVEVRTATGKGPNRVLRRSGKIPAICYGNNRQPQAYSVEPRLLTKCLLEEGGKNRIYELKGQGVEGRHVLVKDYQVDPVKRNLLHVDLMEINVSEKVEVTVTLNFTGKAKGVVEGGILNIVERELLIQCLPSAIPNHIDVDVTELNIGDSIHVEDLVVPEGIEKVGAADTTLVGVVPPAKEEEAAPVLAEGAEPEVITEKKAAEGEAADKDKGKEK